MVGGLLTSDSFSTLTNKQIYDPLADFPLPKVVRESPSSRVYELVWKHLYSCAINSESRQLVYLLIYNKLPVPERLFQIGLVKDPYCQICPGAIESDIVNFFCDCLMTKSAWTCIRSTILSLTYSLVLCSNFDLLNLLLPFRSNEEILWLIGKYVKYVWATVYVNEGEVKVDQLLGFLKFKYKSERLIRSEKFDRFFK